MSFRTRLLLTLAALLLVPSLALAAASPAAPETPQASAVTVEQPFAALSTAAPLCTGAAPLVLSPEPQPTATDLCGPCSDTACVGKVVNSVCGVGFRCIAGSPTCSTAALFRCRCLII